MLRFSVVKLLPTISAMNYSRFTIIFSMVCNCFGAKFSCNKYEKTFIDKKFGQLYFVESFAMTNGSSVLDYDRTKHYFDKNNTEEGVIMFLLSGPLNGDRSFGMNKLVYATISMHQLLADKSTRICGQIPDTFALIKIAENPKMAIVFHACNIITGTDAMIYFVENQSASLPAAFKQWSGNLKNFENKRFRKFMPCLCRHQKEFLQTCAPNQLRKDLKDVLETFDDYYFFCIIMSYSIVYTLFGWSFLKFST